MKIIYYYVMADVVYASIQKQKIKIVNLYSGRCLWSESWCDKDIKNGFQDNWEKLKQHFIVKTRFKNENGEERDGLEHVTREKLEGILDKTENQAHKESIQRLINSVYNQRDINTNTEQEKEQEEVEREQGKLYVYTDDDNRKKEKEIRLQGTKEFIDDGINVLRSHCIVHDKIKRTRTIFLQKHVELLLMLLTPECLKSIFHKVLVANIAEELPSTEQVEERDDHDISTDQNAFLIEGEESVRESSPPQTEGVWRRLINYLNCCKHTRESPGAGFSPEL